MHAISNSYCLEIIHCKFIANVLQPTAVDHYRARYKERLNHCAWLTSKSVNESSCYLTENSSKLNFSEFYTSHIRAIENGITMYFEIFVITELIYVSINSRLWQCLPL